MNALRIGTRGSDLALQQARAVASALERCGAAPCELRVIRTSGDRIETGVLSEFGGKGLFVKEIEEALSGNEIDIAVHSAKDLPVVVPSGLIVQGYLPREDARDGFVLPRGVTIRTPATILEILEQFGPEPRIGTSSVRRIAQLVTRCPGAVFKPIRGNLDTRLRKVDGREYDVIVLAVAGLRRLGFAHRLSAAFTVDEWVPAPGQGAIAMETRGDDTAANESVARVDDPNTRTAVTAERALVKTLGGGCQMPIGAYAVVKGSELHLDAVVSSLDGTHVPRFRLSGVRDEPEMLGHVVAQRLLEAGAADILGNLRRSQVSETDES